MKQKGQRDVVMNEVETFNWIYGKLQTLHKPLIRIALYRPLHFQNERKHKREGEASIISRDIFKTNERGMRAC